MKTKMTVNGVSVCPTGEERHEYFTRMGFDDFDGEELFVLPVPQDMSARRRNYSPVGTKSIDIDLRTRTRREEFLLGLKEVGCVEHASEWLEERMRGPVFMAKAMYYGSDFVGQMLVTGTQNAATLEMVCVAPKWRGRGCLLYASPSPRDRQKSRMTASA